MAHQVKAGPCPAAGDNSDNWRLDPYAISSRVSYRVGGTSYTIDRCGVSIKRTLANSGLPLSMAVPARVFKGVAARVDQRADGSQRVSLELHHHDPALSVPVLVADNLDDIAADWHSWSRLMRLPMLIVDADDIARPVRNELGAVMIEDPIERRKRITSLKHRPWFLRRRKTCSVGEVVRIGAAEIIARN